MPCAKRSFFLSPPYVSSRRAPPRADATARRSPPRPRGRSVLNAAGAWRTPIDWVFQPGILNAAFYTQRSKRSVLNCAFETPCSELGVIAPTSTFGSSILEATNPPTISLA
eukprot:2994825-Pleurochrysis_carterae.AAC.1